MNARLLIRVGSIEDMDHEHYIRECHGLAIVAGKIGNHTFGSLLVHDDQILLEAENTVNTDQDEMHHAEYNLVTRSRQTLPREILKQSILYTSTAPCLLCTASIQMAGIPKIVYSVSHEAFGRLIPGEYKYIPCEEIIRRTGGKTEVVGPVLEQEGMKVFQWWGGRFTALEEILKSTGK